MNSSQQSQFLERKSPPPYRDGEGDLGGGDVWRGLLGYALLALFLSGIFPPDTSVKLDPQQTVITQKDHICVHTRLIDEVSEQVIQDSLRLVREMGAETIVEFFPWAYVENSEGRYDWSQSDRIITHANNQGIRVIARMGLVPLWARQDKPHASTFNYLPDESFDEFAKFVAAFTARYAGQVEHIIIWNEPNLAFEWGFRPPNPNDYVRLLRAVYPLAKEANPNVTILGGALAPTLEPETSPNGINDLIYLERLYQAGADAYFDALSIHTYGFTNSALAAPQPDALNFRRAELLREMMLKYGDTSPVYITETGWNDHPRWANSVRPSQRIQYTIDAFRYAENNWDWAEEVCIWVFRYPTPTFSYPDNWTLVTTDMQLKPIYHAIQAYALGTPQEDTLWLSPPAASSLR